MLQPIDVWCFNLKLRHGTPTIDEKEEIRRPNCRRKRRSTTRTESWFPKTALRQTLDALRSNCL